jgi:hypothetical protein
VPALTTAAVLTLLLVLPVTVAEKLSPSTPFWLRLLLQVSLAVEVAVPPGTAPLVVLLSLPLLLTVRV